MPFLRALCLITASIACLPSSARAQSSAADEAKTLYSDGKAAFEAGQHARALLLFDRAHSLSGKPELLFNMASALEKLDRPAEAADKLRLYLRVRPDDPDRAAIEERVAAYETKQKVLDIERARREEVERVRREESATAARREALGREEGLREGLRKQKMSARNRGLAIGLSTAGVLVIVGLSVGLAVGLQPPDPLPTATNAGTFQVGR